MNSVKQQTPLDELHRYLSIFAELTHPIFDQSPSFCDVFYKLACYLHREHTDPAFNFIYSYDYPDYPWKNPVYAPYLRAVEMDRVPENVDDPAIMALYWIQQTIPCPLSFREMAPFTKLELLKRIMAHLPTMLDHIEKRFGHLRTVMNSIKIHRDVLAEVTEALPVIEAAIMLEFGSSLIR